MYGDYPDMGLGGDEAFGVTFLLFYLFYFLIIGLVGLVTYVLTSWGTYSIAKRRGIHNPWLAWLPVGDAWILGCISDQYRYVARGQVKNKRKALLVLNILLYIALIVVFVLLFVLMFQMIGSEFGDAQLPTGPDVYEESMIGSVLGLVFVYLVMLGIAITVAIIRYMALYDLYASCDPSNKALYLILNIFLSITLPIFIFICRNKDLGMPPRKPEPAVPVMPEPVWQPQTEEPWNNE